MSLGIKQTESNPWDGIRENFPSGKVISGEIIKILDKGIIFNLGDGLEGIVHLKKLNKDRKNQIIKSYKEGEKYDVTVQEVDIDLKKIILMMDIDIENDTTEEALNINTPVASDEEAEKIEIPQDVIDQVLDDDENKTDSQNAEEVD